MMKTSVIKAIELEVGGKTLKLSPDEVKELHRALSELIGEPCSRPHTWWYLYSYTPYNNGTISVYGNSTGNLNVPNMGLTGRVETTTDTARLGDNNWSFTN